MMDQGYGLDPVLAFLDGSQGFILQVGCLGFQKAADHMEVVLDPMVDLLHQDLFDLQERFLFFQQMVFCAYQMPEGQVLLIDLRLLEPEGAVGLLF
jgi:hypothetical protein